jgi:hypothetical protein
MMGRKEKTLKMLRWAACNRDVQLRQNVSALYDYVFL